MSSNFYDLDDFLAEEEVVQCRIKFDFSHLSHLDPEASFRNTTTTTHNAATNVLAEGSKISIPLWAVQTWVGLGFCHVMLPTQYRLRARELIQADPASVSLQTTKIHYHQQQQQQGSSDGGNNNNNYCCYYRSGHSIMNVIQKSCYVQAQILYNKPSSIDRSLQLQQLDRSLQEIQQLRETLLQTYTGPRLNQTLDYAISSVGDDVTSFILKLTDLEKRLYYKTSIAATNHQLWKIHGSNYYRICKTNRNSSQQQHGSLPKKANTPRTVTTSSDLVDGRQRGKRMKT